MRAIDMPLENIVGSPSPCSAMASKELSTCQVSPRYTIPAKLKAVA